MLEDRRPRIIFFALSTTFAFFMGRWAVSQGIPYVLELRAKTLEGIPELFFIKPLTGALAPYLTLKILYTFLFNLIFGAFISTTLTGVVFFVPWLVMIWRGFLIGVLFYGMKGGALYTIVFYGTFVLEFGAYCFSSVAGTEIGLAIIKALLQRRLPSFGELSEAFRFSSLLYVPVIILLFVGALWEMSWLHYLGKVPVP